MKSITIQTPEQKAVLAILIENYGMEPKLAIHLIKAHYKLAQEIALEYYGRG